ncbi:MAG: phycobilisome linker polypeptide [Coleofasciculaceae cyanobacterium]
MPEITAISCKSLIRDKSHTVIIRVIGLNLRGRVRRSNYTVKVPYERMLQTMQQLKRFGGKIVSVTIHGACPVQVDSTQPLTAEVLESTQTAGKDHCSTPKLKHRKRSRQTKGLRKVSCQHKTTRARKGRNKPKSQRRANLQVQGYC